MPEVQPPAYQDNGCYTALDDRRALTGLICSEGVTTQGSDLLVQDSTAGGMNVDVLSGGAYILNDFQSNGGMYYVFSNSTVTIPLNAADPTDPRIDLIVARVYDSAYSGALDEWHLEVVTGSPSPAPIAPATPDSAIVLAQIAVPALGSEVVAGWITDTRAYAQICQENVPESLLGVAVFTSSGTFNKSSWPDGHRIRIRVVGGGGGGGGCGAFANTAGGGGGGGGFGERIMTFAQFGTSETVTVGAGGTAGTATSGGTGGTGGQSSFGVHAIGNGGVGGSGGGTTANTVAQGGAGGTAAVGSNGFATAGGAGTDALSQPGFAIAGRGGGSILSPGISDDHISTSGAFAGAAGRSFGGGGGGAFAVAASANIGGVGAQGIVIVEVFA